MQPDKVRSLLEKVSSHACSVDKALAELAHLPHSDLGVARIDHHRALRCGFAEVIFGSGKRVADLLRIVASARQGAPCILATRVDERQAAALRKRFRDAMHNPVARTVRVGKPVPLKTKGVAAVVTAGTSDIPVAEEALETLQAFGCPTRCYYDVGVAGLHRVLAVLPELRTAESIICVAGMEGALPSVIGGLVPCPVIAVPTSVGYGCSLNGLAALLAMLNSCAPGVSVVNIDNGFGAAMCALRILGRRNEGHTQQTRLRREQ
ncbi:MAG: nickel pincer cofactor biosynthesis protein LarB [Planctomycetota bacterium]|nr:nickel pincer cofactor biosynthesis protein LarB [Planctomycetota bacterium]